MEGLNLPWDVAALICVRVASIPRLIRLLQVNCYWREAVSRYIKSRLSADSFHGMLSRVLLRIGNQYGIGAYALKSVNAQQVLWNESPSRFAALSMLVMVYEEYVQEEQGLQLAAHWGQRDKLWTAKQVVANFVHRVFCKRGQLRNIVSYCNYVTFIKACPGKRQDARHKIELKKRAVARAEAEAKQLEVDYKERVAKRAKLGEKLGLVVVK